MTPASPKRDRPLAALLAPDLLELLEEAPEAIASQTDELHPADLADICEAFPEELLGPFLAALPKDRAADVLEYLDEDVRVTLLEELSAREAASLVAAMTPDDRADILEELDEDVADELLAELTPEARRETEKLLEYDPYSAGGLMTTEFVSVDESTTVEDALVSVRAMARAGRKEAMNTIYTMDAGGRLRGVLSLRELLAAPEGAKLADVAWTDVVTVPPTAAQEEVAQLTSNYDLVSVPVVDEARRLIGVVTVDDVIDVIQEEQTEDVQKLGGMEAIDEPYMTAGFFTVLGKRAGWLSVLFVGEMFTASAIQHFEHELARAIVLTLFIPLIIASGGNSGSQATSLIIRAMALGEVTLRDWWRVASREVPSGFTLGALLGAIGFLRIMAWQWMHDAGWRIGSFALGTDYGTYHLRLALTIWIALIGVVTFGSTAGSMLPFVLKRFGFDPASASAPLVATLVDVTGLVIYFSAAALLLGGVLL
ncbi:MAG: magnesium transporter [Gemmatimonadaceae bacterium]|jgi:magnesium transporter|nr:magnesium transporter [Gemmatimonadaceae bacterium]